MVVLSFSREGESPIGSQKMALPPDLRTLEISEEAGAISR